jgi:hypothetical protein
MARTRHRRPSGERGGYRKPAWCRAQRTKPSAKISYNKCAARWRTLIGLRRWHPWLHLARSRVIRLKSGFAITGPASRKRSKKKYLTRGRGSDDSFPACPHSEGRNHRKRMTNAIKASAACYGCNPILAGRNQVVTRSHENLRITRRSGITEL